MAVCGIEFIEMRKEGAHGWVLGIIGFGKLLWWEVWRWG